MAAFFSIRPLGRRLWFGVADYVLAEAPRLVLPLPFVSQSGTGSDGAPLAVVGGVLFAGSLVLGTPVFRIVALRAPAKERPLRTDGLCSAVGHPLMLCDVLWPLVWSLAFGSAHRHPAGAYLVCDDLGRDPPKGEALVQEYGDSYRRYQASVPPLARCRRFGRL